jgi:hypothetical protein
MLLIRERKRTCKYCGTKLKKTASIYRKYCDFECSNEYNSLMGKIKSKVIGKIIKGKKEYILNQSKKLVNKKLKEMKRNGNIKPR